MLTVSQVTLVDENGHDINWGGAGYAFLNRYVRTLPNVERVSIFTPGGISISYKNGEKTRSNFTFTDGEFWKLFEFSFLEGRPFTAQDERDAGFVAVINEATRKKFFGDQPAVGKTIEVDGQNYHVIGVVANVPDLRRTFSDIWVPISTSKSQAYRSESLTGSFAAVILARKRSDIPVIKEEFRSTLSRVELPAPTRYNRIYSGAYTDFERLSREMVSSKYYDSDFYGETHTGRLLATIVGAMILFMLLPALNLMNLNISRILERASEIGVRKAFGASSRTLIGQFVVENVLLTLIGGLVGFVLSFLILDVLSRSGLIRYAQFHMNYRICLYGLLITVFFGVFSGVYPAWRMSRLHPIEALRRKP